jgi:hypothetical protein
VQRLGGLSLGKRPLNERDGAMAYAVQVFLLTVGCHLEVIGGKVHSWAAVGFLTAPILFWVSAIYVLRRSWHTD